MSIKKTIEAVNQEDVELTEEDVEQGNADQGDVEQEDIDQEDADQGDVEQWTYRARRRLKPSITRMSG
jgi:hypothetical protein